MPQPPRAKGPLVFVLVLASLPASLPALLAGGALFVPAADKDRRAARARLGFALVGVVGLSLVLHGTYTKTGAVLLVGAIARAWLEWIALRSRRETAHAAEVEALLLQRAKEEPARQG